MEPESYVNHSFLLSCMGKLDEKLCSLQKSKSQKRTEVCKVFSKIFKKWNFLEKLAHFQFSTSIPISVLTFLLIFIWLFLSFHFEIRALCIWESVETPPIVSIFLACCWGSKKRRRLGYLWYSVSNVYGIPL